MYSVVLMAALTTGTDMPDFGRRGWGCCGCYGGRGWGGGYGGYAWGGGWGRGWGGGYGGWGRGWGGGYGGWGGWGGYVYAPYFTGAYAAPALASNMLPTTTPTLGTRSMYYNPAPSATNRATIIVHLPEAATLTVNGKPTVSTSATRRFYSPPLDANTSYDYTFEARMDRNGKMVKTDRLLSVRAGDQLEITLTLPALNPSLPPESDTLPDEKTGNRDKAPPPSPARP